MAENETLLSRVLWFFASVLVAALLIGLWQLAAEMKWVSPVFMPPPSKAWNVLVADFSSGELIGKLLATVSRIFAGWAIATVVGVSLGTLIGISPLARAYVGPTLEALRPLPVAALVPIFIGILGFTEQMVLVVITFGAMWPILLNTVHGLSAVEPRLYEVARALGLSRMETIRKIALPSATPDILAGMRVGLTISLILVVIGEILASRQGIGYWILLSQRSYLSADLFAGIVLLGVIGYLSAVALNVFERRVLFWR